MSIQAYPLQWPTGWKRTEQHKRARAKFGKIGRHERYGETSRYIPGRDLTISEGTQRILAELKTFGVLDGDLVISTNLKLRLDGLPHSAQPAPQDPGVAVYWKLPEEGTHKVMAIDRYDKVQDNMAAIAATLNAMRAIERHGGAAILDRAFTGFIALPAPGQTARRAWRDILGVPDHDKRLTTAEAAYKTLRSKYHPDKNGGLEMPEWHQLQAAWHDANIELGNPG